MRVDKHRWIERIKRIFRSEKSRARRAANQALVSHHNKSIDRFNAALDELDERMRADDDSAPL